MACFLDGITKPVACFLDGITKPVACFQDGITKPVACFTPVVSLSQWLVFWIIYALHLRVGILWVSFLYLTFRSESVEGETKK